MKPFLACMLFVSISCISAWLYLQHREKLPAHIQKTISRLER